MFPTVAHPWVASVICLTQAVLRGMSSCLVTDHLLLCLLGEQGLPGLGLTTQGKTERGPFAGFQSMAPGPTGLPKISGDYWLFTWAFLQSPGGLPCPGMFSLDSGKGVRISSPVFSYYILSSNTLWRCWHGGEFTMMARLVSGGPLPQPP